MRLPLPTHATLKLASVLFLSGLLLALATPPYRQSWAPLVAVTILAAALFREATPDKRIRRGFGLGFLFGLGVNMAALRFVPAVVVRFTPLSYPVALLALLLLSLAQALAFGVVGGVFSALARLGVPRPFAFAAAMFASTFTPAVFPWTMASGMTPWAICMQTADIWGERGVTTFWALACGTLASAFLTFKAGEHATAKKQGALAFGGVAVVLGYGAVRMQMFPESDGDVSIGLVSQAVDPKERWDVFASAKITSKLHELTRATEREGAVLTVWPEAAYPYGTPRGTTTDLYGERSILGPGVHGPVLSGIILRHGPGTLSPDDPGGSTNSAVLVTFDKMQGIGRFSEPSDKIHLLTFGEHVPLTGVFPQLRRIFFRGGKGLVPGTRNVHMKSGDVRAGMMNCFEDTLTEAGRGAILEGPAQANLLINITNDAWFKDSGESELHEQMARLRAIETRRDLLRAVNYGPLSRVDAAGRIREHRAPPVGGVPTYLLTKPKLREGMTLYAKLGDTPLTLVFASLVAFSVRRILRKRHEKTAES